MSSHTFHELEKWHKSIIHRYGYIVMPHMSHKINSYCEELDFFIERAKDKMSVTMDSSRKSDIRIMIEHISHLKKHAEPMCKKPSKKEDTESTTESLTVSISEPTTGSKKEESDETSLVSKIQSFFGTSEKETESLNEEETTSSTVETESNVSKPKRAMSKYNIFVKERYDELKEENSDKSTPEIMKIISEEWKSKKGSYTPSKEEETESLKETEFLKEEESSSESESEESSSESESESESDKDIEETLESEEESSQKEKKVFTGGNSWRDKLNKFYL
jgi:hypothetical protein